MRYLILSDIHANFIALEAVLKHARNRYDQLLCLGDLVGYGAEPNEVVDWARDVASTTGAQMIRGNHDRACCGLDSTEDYNSSAQASTSWTTNTLTPGNIGFLRELPKGPIDAGGFDLVHGSHANEDEYVRKPYDADDLREYLLMKVTFFGHTHVQGGFVLETEKADVLAGIPLESDELTLPINVEAPWFLINPGSVGQPRDGDRRAAYAIYDTRLGKQEVTYYRVEYDAEAARQRIRKAGLPAVLGNRLLAGG